MVKKWLLAIGCVLAVQYVSAQNRTIHTFVALCDNDEQGIVRVSEELGDGQSPRTNLYWGAGFGVKSFFPYKADRWQMVKTFKSNSPYILERVLFKHENKDAYMLADAYDGRKIKRCIKDFLKAANGQNAFRVNFNHSKLAFGGKADLTTYVGHNGLMDFEVDIHYRAEDKKGKDAIVLACYSKNHFWPKLKDAGANPLLWTTHLMSPEAYTLNAAIGAWLNGKSGKAIHERAARAYDAYQDCGIKGARKLFTTGF